MSQWPLEMFNENGFAVIEDFFTDQETSELHEAGLKLCKDAPEKERAIFDASTNEQKRVHLREKYFLDSADKIHYFYENGALDANGNLVVEKTRALNKVGHALHTLHPIFKKYTFDERVKNIGKRLGFKKPVIPQSMFIYKNPKIGGEVKPHQDATYLHTDPISITGFWIPTEDATLENGCLWFIKGSHKHGLDRRMIRNADKSSAELLKYDGPEPRYSQDQFVACPVKKGSLVIIHGLVVHQSDWNRSDKSRFAYTFHIMESENVKYSTDNWLQLPEGETFPEL